MLTQVADGVLVHESEFIKSNGIVVQGPDGVLLVDPGVVEQEIACLARDLAGRAVVAGFSTHPDWDHVLWLPSLGEAPRYGTAECAAAIREQLADPDAKTAIRDHLEGTGIEDDVPLELLGLVTALPAGATEFPWDGPRVRILEHRAHAQGHAALFIEERGVLLAGDMLSDVLVPMLDWEDSGDPIAAYLAALDLLERTAGGAEVVVPGHGSVGGAGQVKARIDLDRAYVLALRDGHTPDDPRIGPNAPAGWEWVNDVHQGQVQQRAAR
ncbi:MBL fold metallo-hydrolase [Dactylosporangium sp. CS-047395]|uniref:MBL fold metallo-hydrolase n=1 Tax=Dactylosporangium sp. CS-047395 TaxID=3239936 RepID=UPI003D8C6607